MLPCYLTVYNSLKSYIEATGCISTDIFSEYPITETKKVNQDKHGRFTSAQFIKHEFNYRNSTRNHAHYNKRKVIIKASYNDSANTMFVTIQCRSGCKRKAEVFDVIGVFEFNNTSLYRMHIDYGTPYSCYDTYFLNRDNLIFIIRNNIIREYFIGVPVYV